MRPLAVLLLLVPGCFTDAPPVDEAAVEDGGSSSEGTEPQESSDGESGEESSSGGEVDPLDAYGPCEVDDDCPLIPGDEGEVGESPRCVAGTCAIRCSQAAHSDAVCPGYFDFKDSEVGAFPMLCGDDGYCTITRDYVSPYNGCPDGMVQGDAETVPALACVWPAS